MGDRTLMCSVAEAFLDDMKQQIEELKTVVTAGDVEQTATQAHKIKGASANVGGLALSACAKEMEYAGKAGDAQAVGREVARMDELFLQLSAAMKDALFETVDC